jgi:hypothetical protein
MEVLLSQVSVISPPENYFIYYDDSLDIIVVRDSDGLEVLLLDLGVYGIDWIATGSIGGDSVRSPYQFCDGSTLVEFEAQKNYPPYPVFEKVLTFDSPSCSVDPSPPVCDLEINNFPLIVNADNETSANGQVTVTATSSNGSIEFKLSPFSYGGGQSSGVFSNLLPGNYTVYAVDEVGCQDQLNITIGNDNALDYQPYIRYEYTSEDDDALERIHRVDIELLGWTGGIKNVRHGGGSPVIYDKPVININDKISAVQTASLNITLWANENGEYRPLYTQNDRKYRVRWFKNTGLALVEKFRGWIQPSIYSEPYIVTPYPVSIIAADGLPTLNQFDFIDDNGNDLKGKYKIIELVALCLRKLDLGLNIKVATNVFEARMIDDSDSVQDPSICPFDLAYIDTSFYLGKTCDELLKDVMQVFQARIYQWQGAWYITRLEEETAPYDFREYDSRANFISASSLDPLYENLLPLLQNHVLEIIPSYGLVTLQRPLNERLSLIPGEFGKDDLKIAGDNASGFVDWTFVLNGATGLSLIRRDISNPLPVIDLSRFDRTGTTRESQRRPEISIIDDSIASIEGIGNNKRNAYIISKPKPIQYRSGDAIEVSFNYGLGRIAPTVPFWIIRFKLRIGAYYLQPNGSFAESDAEFRFYPTPKNEMQNFRGVFEVPDNVLTDTDISFQIFNYRMDINTYEFSSITNLKALPTLNIDTEYKTDVLIASNQIGFYELIDSDDAEDSPNLIEPGDYATTTNEKMWRLVSIVTPRTLGLLANQNQFLFDALRIRYYPNFIAMPRLETINVEVQKGIRENIELNFNLGDIPDQFIVNAKNSYNNVLFLANGEVTQSWSRPQIAESSTLQKIGIKTFLNQYYRPTEKISGTYYSTEEIAPFNTIKFTKPLEVLPWLNEDFTNPTTQAPWQQTIGAVSWIGTNSGYVFVVLDESDGSIDSTIIYQAVEVDSFTRVKLSVDVTRTLTDPSPETQNKLDVFQVVCLKDNIVVQTINVLNFSNDDTITTEFEFTLIQNVDAIGFRVKHIGGFGVARYDVSLFQIEGAPSLAFYSIMGLSLDDRFNRYELTLAETIPMVGDPNAEPGEGEAPNAGGDDFSGDFNEDFGGDFDTILN